MPDKTESHKPNSTRRRFQLVTVALLMAAIWLPTLVQIALPAPSQSLTEKRFLAPWPSLTWSIEGLSTWPASLEAWYDDHLGFRDWLIGSWARFNVQGFGISPSPLTVIGKEGWLFLGDPDAISNYRGLAPLTPFELERWRQVLTERRDWLARQGIEYLVVLVPDKNLIYSEYMPDSLPQAGQNHPLGQLSTYLETRSDLPSLDLREIMLEKKAATRLYHKTDSHWNDAGAYLAYQEIHQRLREQIPSLNQAQPTRVRSEEYVRPGLGLAVTVSMENQYPESVVSLTPIAPQAKERIADETQPRNPRRVLKPRVFETADPLQPRAIVFRDSFANALIPYLAEDFSRSVFIWDRDVDPEAVLMEKPDVVIQEIAGRFLGRRPRTLDEIRARNKRRQGK